MVLPGLVVPEGAVRPRLDARRHVLPVVDSLLRQAGEVIGGLDGVVDVDRLDLPPTVAGSADPQVNRLAADGCGGEGGVFTFDARGHPLVDGVVEAHVLEVRGGLRDLVRLDVADRRERAVGHIRQHVERDHVHDQEGQDCERRDDAVRVEPLRAAEAAGVVSHGISLMCARASPYQRALAASCETGLGSSSPFKLVSYTSLNSELKCTLCKQ